VIVSCISSTCNVICYPIDSCFNVCVHAVIIGREITMSALREWAATMGPAAKAAVAVNAWGKWKTATQMAALTCLLFTRDGASSQLAVAAAAAGPPLLGIAAYLTAHSLAIYLAGLWKYMK
jgi:CDP-diacylglycerol--glycerol-3-phosphate 3-phosphatidyltransferase